jgi:polysaccharide export outer membrane protein
VKHPGVFKIDEKTTLYDVLKKAGGFRENAYPRGIIILRKSVKELQRQRLAKAILFLRQELEKEEAGIMQSGLTEEELKAREAAFEAKRRLLKEIEKTQVTGRISGVVVSFNLEELKNSPYNILLEDGDRIYIPKKPGSVLVLGEVYNPTAYVYRSGMTVRDYIALAGGLTKNASEEEIFVIKADGSVVSSNSLTGGIKFDWDSENNRIVLDSGDILDYVLQPGDAIIVPTEIKVPVVWRLLLKDVMQILYQGAVVVYTITKL